MPVLRFCGVSKRLRRETYFYGRSLYVIVTDAMAGKPARYTVHRIDLMGEKTTQVVGRELPLRHARSLVPGIKE